MINTIQSWRESSRRYQNLGKTGKIISLTFVQTAVTGFSSWLPYYVAIIKLDKGEKVTGQLVDAARPEPKINDRVIGVLRRTREPGKEEIIEYGVKWKLINK